ncbi:hypothetical protein [Paraburkholderia terrae]|nr:hypothetical protein [Paraburkholderia terrae]
MGGLMASWQVIEYLLRELRGNPGYSGVSPLPNIPALEKTQ